MSRVSAAIDLIYDFIVDNIVSVEKNDLVIRYSHPIIPEINKILLVLRWFLETVKGVRFVNPRDKERILSAVEKGIDEVREIMKGLAEEIREINDDAAEALKILANATTEQLLEYRSEFGIKNDILIARWREKQPF